jgi:hypothetical protein
MTWSLLGASIERLESNSTRGRKVNRILLAWNGQAVGQVRCPLCQKLIVWRTVKKIKSARDFSRTPYHPLAQLAVTKVFFMETSRGTTGENVPPEPFCRFPARPEQPTAVAAVYFNITQRTGRREDALPQTFDLIEMGLTRLMVVLGNLDKVVGLRIVGDVAIGRIMRCSPFVRPKMAGS